MAPDNVGSAGLKPTTLMELLRRRAELQPDHCVYTFLEDDATTRESHFTHAHLDKRAQAIGAELQALGAGGERVLLLYPSGLEYIAAFFGCLYAGAIAVPAYPPRPKRDLPRLQAIIADAQATVALTTTTLLMKLEPSLSTAPDLQQLRWLATDKLTDEGAERWREPGVTGQTVAFLQYTSGSTAAPRGVVLNHETVLANAALIQQCFETSPLSRGVFWLPFYHDMGLIGGLLQPLYCGAMSTLFSPLTFLQRPFRWLEIISQTKADISGGPNFAYELCVRKTTEAERATLDLSSWRLAFNGAEPIRAETLARFTRAFAPCGFRSEAFYPCYGLAEATLIVTGGAKSSAPVIRAFDDAALTRNQVRKLVSANGSGRELVSSGRIRDSQKLAIVNPESRKRVGPSQVGEVWVAGPGVASGYWNRPDESSATFHGYLAENSEGPFLRTGDLGFIDHDELFVTGRIKDLIIIRGRNYHAHDIELTVEQCHPALRPSGCAAFSVEINGAEQLVIVAELERQYRQLDLKELMNQIRRAVTEQHDVQVSALTLAKPGSVPRTTSGKLQRSGCRKKFLTEKLEVISRWVPTQTNEILSIETTRLAIETCDSDSQTQNDSSSALAISKSRAEDLIAWLRTYSSERINSRLIDERRSIPPYVVLDFGNRGILGMEVPEEYGGIALCARDALRVVEQLAAIDLTLASFVGVNNVLGIRPILRFAESSVRDELLPTLARGRELAAFALTEPGAGSNPRAIASVGIPDGAGGWRLHGTKSWIGSASWAGITNVFVKLTGLAQQEEGITAFWVRQGTRGLRQGAEALTMGMRGMVQNAIHLEDVPVGRENLLGAAGEGFTVAQDAMMLGRLGIGAMSVGGMKRCAQLMLRFASRREIATGPLLDNPVTRARLSSLTAELAAAEMLVAKVADLLDQERIVPAEVFSVCKIAGPEFLWSAADTLVQLLGGRGYLESNIAPQLLRDARLLRIFEGPTETLNMFLGSSVLHGEQLDQFLRHELNSVNVAGALRDTVAQIDARSAEFNMAFGDATAGRRWIASLVGQTATRALLWGVLQDSCAHSPSGQLERARRWAQDCFQQTSKRALEEFPAAATMLSTEATTKLIESYADAIGDLEQSLGGEDHELDPLLRRAAQANKSAGWGPYKAFNEGNGVKQNGFHAPIAEAEKLPNGNKSPKVVSADSPVDSPASSIRTVAAEQEILSQLQKFLAGALRVPAETLDVARPLYSLGLDSLVAVELKNHIEENFGVVLSITTFLEEVSLAKLAELVAGKSVATPTRVCEPVTAARSFTEHRLSYGQQALWLLAQLAPQSTAYNVSVAFQINGSVDQAALTRALQLLIDRHPSLRTSFSTQAGEPIQRVHSDVIAQLDVEEAASLTEAELQSAISAEAQRTFALEKAPLIRVRLYRRTNVSQVLLLVLHHIIEDSWSLGLILYELAQLYTAERGGEVANLTPLQYSYGEFVRRQREMLTASAGEELWRYWQLQLEGAPNTLALPTDRPRPAVQSYRGAAHTIQLSGALAQQLRAFSEAQGVTLFMTLLAAYQVLLYRYTDQEDILVGSPMLGRNGAELSGIVGYFANPVVLRARLGNNPTFAEFLGQVRGTVHEAFAHQDFPFSLLVERLQPQRDPSRSPLFQTMFTLQKDLADNLSLLSGARIAAGRPLELAGVPLERYPLDQHFAQFDLSLMVTELRGGLAATVEYNVDLFDEATIERLAANLETVLESIVREPDSRVANLPLLAKAERLELLGWGQRRKGATTDSALQEIPASAAAASSSSSVDFSLFYFSCNEARFAADKYQLLIEGAKFADRAGFTAVWTPERHFHAFGGIYPNPSVLGAALAMITERVRIRAGSVVLPLHNPIRVAEEWSVVDNLARGRVDLAFATGWSARDFILAPERHANRKEIMFAAIETVRRLWRGENLLLPAADGTTAEVKLHPLPMQSELPVWIACAGNPESFRAAGEIGANVLTTLLMQSVEELAERISLYRDARRQHGLDPNGGQVTVMLHTFVGEKENQVRAQVLPPFKEYLRTSVELWGHEARKLELLNEKEREDLLAYSCERYFQTSALFGTPQTCAAMVERLQTIGVNEVACLIDFGVDFPAVMSSLSSLDTLRQKFMRQPQVPAPEAVVQPEDPRLGDRNGQTIHQLIEAQVRATPTRVALICDDQTLTYHELNASADRLAHHLRQLGVKPDKLVGILVDRSSDMVVALLAVLKSGGAYVPLDPTQPAARIARMLDDAKVSVLLTLSHLVENLPPIAAKIVCLDAERAIASEADNDPTNFTDPDNLAYVIYTSGSTGRPKGVQVSHAAVVNFLGSLAQEIAISADDKLLAVTTLSFDIAALELLLPLTVGAAVEVAGSRVATDGWQLAARLQSSGATVMQATPATWQMVLEAGWAGNERVKILCGGEALTRELADQLLARSKSCWNLYGPTETTIWSALHRLEQPETFVSLGGPIANTQLYVLDRQMRLAPVGAAGELYIGGEGLARGYLHEPALTAERFLPDPFGDTPGGRLYRTGDRVRFLNDGVLEFLGRADQQIKLRGHRIEPGEIESVLRENAAVRDARVLLREEATGEKRLIAYVLSDLDSTAVTIELRAFLPERLPRYMWPGAFVTLTDWPLTPNGKLDHKALPAPEAPGLQSNNYLAPQSELEQTLAALWQDVLGIDRVGTQDNFFDLGGHSLLLARVHSRLRDRLPNELSLLELFRYPTISSLAAHLSASANDDASVRQGQARALTRQTAMLRRRQQREAAPEQ